MADVILTTEATDQFNKLPRTIRARMLGMFERLRSWPEVSGAKPLRGDLAGKWRLRTGDYRLQFRVETIAKPETVVVEKIGHRRDFYEE